MGSKSVSISQGEFAVSRDHDAVISTILGSCVSACIWDDVAHVGGMNHILVAQRTVDGTACDFAGVNAMELLINAMVRKGADRNRLKAKVFGGARMVKGLSDIGRANGDFALNFLQQEGIECLGHSLGGESARHIRFFPAQGRVMQKTVAATAEMEPKAAPVPARNGVELF